MAIDDTPLGGAADGLPEGFDPEKAEIPELMPMLPIRDVVIFPYMILPLFVGRDRSIKAVEESLKAGRMIFLNTQKEITDEDPDEKGLHDIGTVGLIMRMLKLPDGRVKILVQGLTRARRLELVSKDPYLQVRIQPMPEVAGAATDFESEALIRSVREKVEAVVDQGKGISTEIMMVLENVEDMGRLADIVAANMNLKLSDAISILSEPLPRPRLELVLALIERELQVLEVQKKIKSAAKEEMSRSQREYYLRQQMKAIQDELGVSDEHSEEMDKLKASIEKAKMSKEAREEALKELARLKDMSPSSAEASVIRTYIDWLVSVPWKKATKDRLDLKVAKEVLDEDHYNLEKVKERILEHLAVKKLKPDAKGPILCFVGPPGVGKTSLGQSIARAMGRKFVRMSLGGVKDEAEIRGHRRTYVGALPGRVIQGIKKAGTNNPVFVLDEVDKIGQDFRGDPSSALLEVLDPAQNSTFEDHYLNVAFDLSGVMFICTANLTDPIPPALLDRMEVIRLSGYTREEKLKIGRKYILPRQMSEQGITATQIRFSDEALSAVADQYTRESGLRNFEREIANICRKVARKVAEGHSRLQTITKGNLASYLGPPVFLEEEGLEADLVGVTNGLAWTQAGGDMLFIESTTTLGHGKLILTGQLGDVMKESAQTAFSWARGKAEEYGVDNEFFDKRQFHVHVPAGAIPKDGPSAGITIATSLLSLMTGRPVDSKLAMTGEISLRGRVLPIGGVKEKCLAARRAGIKRIILPERNRKDLAELPPEARKSLEFHFVTTMDQVAELALKPKAKPDTKPAAKPAAKPKAKARLPETKPKAKPGKTTNKK